VRGDGEGEDDGGDGGEDEGGDVSRKKK